MKKELLPVILTLTMGLSFPAFAGETAEDTAAGTEETTEAAAEETKDEAKAASKTAFLLADGYEPMDGLVIPVGVSNKELEAENLEPEKAEKLTIEGSQGKDLNLYVFRPADYEEGEVTPVIYYIHGGGYQFGNTGMFEGTVQDVADGSSATVDSVEKDPDYKYPMELEDAYAGLLYVYEHADELNVDPDRIVIEGESAGGGLTARLALYNRDKGKVPLKGQILVYPMLDYRTGGKDDLYNNEYTGEFIWTRDNNTLGWADLIAGQDGELPEEEMIYFSPATATVEQLKGLPETFMIVGSLDLFCDEDMDYAQKLMEAGVFTELFVEPGVPHAYESFSWTPQAERFNELRNDATARMLGIGNESEASDAEELYGFLLQYLLGE